MGLPSYEMVTVVNDAHEGDVNCVAWNPKDSKILASCGDDGLIKIWEWS
jgi:WD40 repeat protein